MGTTSIWEKRYIWQMEQRQHLVWHSVKNAAFIRCKVIVAVYFHHFITGKQVSGYLGDDWYDILLFSDAVLLQCLNEWLDENQKSLRPIENFYKNVIVLFEIIDSRRVMQKTCLLLLRPVLDDNLRDVAPGHLRCSEHICDGHLIDAHREDNSPFCLYCYNFW